jgi:hypothetical protein
MKLSREMYIIKSFWSISHVSMELVSKILETEDWLHLHHQGLMWWVFWPHVVLILYPWNMLLSASAHMTGNSGPRQMVIGVLSWCIPVVEYGRSHVFGHHSPCCLSLVLLYDVFFDDSCSVIFMSGYCEWFRRNSISMLKLLGHS